MALEARLGFRFELHETVFHFEALLQVDGLVLVSKLFLSWQSLEETDTVEEANQGHQFFVFFVLNLDKRLLSVVGSLVLVLSLVGLLLRQNLRNTHFGSEQLHLLERRVRRVLVYGRQLLQHGYLRLVRG